MLKEALDDYQIMIGSENDYLATRVAFKLDLRGPAVTVQTACSTSLVAVHMACRSLLDGECDVALAGGVSVRVPQKAGYIHKESGMYSPDGHTRPFDAHAANGFRFGGRSGRSEALKDALADGDPIRAVIRGSAVNNDGASKAGFTAPSAPRQAAAIRKALAAGGVDANTLTTSRRTEPAHKKAIRLKSRRSSQPWSGGEVQMTRARLGR